jgi:hypothetical protein
MFSPLDWESMISHEADSDWLAANIEKNSQQAVVIGQNSIFKLCSIVDAYLIETLSFQNVKCSLTLDQTKFLAVCADSAAAS